MMNMWWYWVGVGFVGATVFWILFAFSFFAIDAVLHERRNRRFAEKMAEQGRRIAAEKAGAPQ